MEADPLLTALSKLEQLVNIRFNAINDKFQVVSAKLDALNVNVHHLHSKFDNFGEKFQHVNTKVDELSSKITLHEKVDSMHSFTNYVTILQLAILPFQVDILRQNDVLSNLCYRFGNPTAKKITQHMYQNQNSSLMVG
jgi:hypothetical protein